ncbi:MAG: CpsD/CapB family tyrosine-protein kinase [Acetatifactor sp.]|jgi:capsular exopolysaccharide synthesis family protein|nr:CpsD/CapB family tyrosine-protein kinase [Acetatifactor sp.]
MGEIISFYRSDNQMMNDAIDRVVVEIYKKKRQSGDRTFLMTGCSSGCGTTTNAINLSIALSVAGWKTVLLDCDLRKGAKYKRLSENIRIGLGDYLSTAERELQLDDIIYPTNYPTLDYIPCGHSSGSPITLFCTVKMEQLIDELEKEYDYILLDFPSINAVSDADILIPRVDDTILVLGFGMTSKKQLTEAKRKVEEFPDKYIGLLINRVEFAQYRNAIRDYDYFRQANLKKRYKRQMKGRVKGRVKKAGKVPKVKKAKKVKKEKK